MSKPEDTPDHLGVIVYMFLYMRCEPLIFQSNQPTGCECIAPTPSIYLYDVDNDVTVEVQQQQHIKRGDCHAAVKVIKYINK